MARSWWTVDPALPFKPSTWQAGPGPHTWTVLKSPNAGAPFSVEMFIGGGTLVRIDPLTTDHDPACEVWCQGLGTKHPTMTDALAFVSALMTACRDLPTEGELAAE